MRLEKLQLGECKKKELDSDDVRTEPENARFYFYRFHSCVRVFNNRFETSLLRSKKKRGDSFQAKFQVFAAKRILID